MHYVLAKPQVWISIFETSLEFHLHSRNTYADINAVMSGWLVTLQAHNKPAIVEDMT